MEKLFLRLQKLCAKSVLQCFFIDVILKEEKEEKYTGH